MKNAVVKWMVLLTMLLLASASQASITLGFGLVTQSGATVDVPIWVSGLSDGSAPSLGAYDLDIGFDIQFLDYASVRFSNQLDVYQSGLNPAAVEPVESVPGLLNLYELSLDSVNDLNAFQANSFTLATLTFNVLKPSNSTLTMAVNALSDAQGDPLRNVRVQTSAPITTVPIPPASWLMLSGLGLWLRRSRSQKCSHREA